MLFDLKKKKNTCRKRLRDFVEKNFYVNNTFSDSDSFFENGIIDSTGVLELVGFIEKSFDIVVEDDEVIPENLDSIECLINYIKTKTDID